MYIPADFFKLYELQAVQGTLPGKVEAKDYSENVVVMNEAALKAFGYTKQEEAFVRGEQALWITSSMDGKIVEGGLSLMPVGTVIKDYYTGHLTAGKKPVVYIVTPGYGGAQFQIACKAGKEKELIKYLQDTRGNFSCGRVRLSLAERGCSGPV